MSVSLSRTSSTTWLTSWTGSRTCHRSAATSSLTASLRIPSGARGPSSGGNLGTWTTERVQWRHYWWNDWLRISKILKINFNSVRALVCRPWFFFLKSRLIRSHLLFSLDHILQLNPFIEKNSPPKFWVEGGINWGYYSELPSRGVSLEAKGF